MQREDGFVDLPDGGRMWFQDVGEGPAVALVHPGLWDARTWDQQMDPLADARYRVLRYDVRGYGRSSDPTGPYADEDDLRAVLDARGIDRVALVGCSMGGDIAIRFTLRWPERVWGLIPVASGLQGWDWNDEEFEELFAGVDEVLEAGDLEGAMDLVLRAWVPLGTGDPAGSRIRAIAMDNVRQFAMDESLQIRLDPPAPTRLEQIDAPTLVVVGDSDVRDIERISDLLATKIPGARKFLIEGADHVVNMRQPQEFNDAVLAFLAEVGEA
jgi:pimeloyl-ACP methyl ester carboxylesterase